MPLLPHISKSRRGDTVWLANAGVQKGSGLAINDGFTVQYAHVAGGGGVKRKIVDGRVERMGGVDGQSPSAQWLPYGARWRWRRRPSMHFFNGGAGRGARGAGGVPSRSPTRSRAGGQNGGDGSTEGRRDGGTEGILVHDFTLPSPRTLADPRTGLSRLSAPVAIVISPGVIFHNADGAPFRPQVPMLV